MKSCMLLMGPCFTLDLVQIYGFWFDLFIPSVVLGFYHVQWFCFLNKSHKMFIWYILSIISCIYIFIPHIGNTAVSYSFVYSVLFFYT